MSLQWKVSHLDHMVICVSEGIVTLQDFQEYLVEFAQGKSERFRFCLYREFELRGDDERLSPGRVR